jgi:hypothetical protein
VPTAWSPAWAERFDRYVVTTADHWLWIGYVDPDDGYGRFKAAGRAQRVHRLAYARWVGECDDEVVLHTCDEHRCVRPDHLRLASYAETAALADNPIAENMRKQACERGHPFDSVNTYPVPSGGRACRTCRREWMRVFRARRAQEKRSAALSTARS